MIPGATAVEHHRLDAFALRGFRGERANLLRAFNVRRQLFAVGVVLCIVDAEASVTPAASSINCT